MVRSAIVVAACLVPCAAVAQITTTTIQGVDSGVALPAGAARDTRAATGTAVIRGRVVDASSGTPLRKASVMIFGAEIRESRNTSTDVDGRFEFTDLPAGQFNVTVNKAGFVSVNYGQAGPNEMGKQLKVGDKQIVDKIDFSLPRGAVITGRVLDEYGEPIADVQVAAIRNQYTPAGSRPLNAGRPGMTNDIGEFRLFGLPPGQYFISAASRGQNFNGPSDGAGYALTYYPGTANLADAQKLTIGVGGTVSDVSLILVPTRTARISGTVFDGQGRPLKQGSVMLMSRTASMTMTTAGGMIRPDGSFTLNGVVPGDYIIRGSVPGQLGMPSDAAVASVSVNGVDLTDVRVEPARPIIVTGRVVMDPAAARSFKPQTVRLSAAPNEPGPMFGPPAPPVAVRDDLTFELKVSAGPSIIRAIAPAGGWMIKSVTLNGADVTDGLTFKNDDVTGLEIELTNRVPDVSGLVTDGKGDPVTDYFAIAFPQEQERWTAPGPGRTGMARADDQGRFRFRTLRPGNYYIVAVDHVQTGEWMDPAFMDAVHTHATRVTINEGDVQTLDLKVVQVR